MKLPFAFVWCVMMYIMIADCNPSCPYPEGICKLHTFSVLFTPFGKMFLWGIIIPLITFYLLEIKMISTTLLLFIISCIVMSYHESNGLFARATVFSVIWFFQFSAYAQHFFKPDFDLRYWRVQYSVQAIAATYTLAGIAKLWASGIGWINAGPLFAIQVMKNYSFLYFDIGDITFMEKGKFIANQLINHEAFLTVILTISLILETFCLVAIIKPQLKIIFAVGMIIMHIGIAITMGIGISAIAFPLLIFFINPLYRFIQLFSRR